MYEPQHFVVDLEKGWQCGCYELMKIEKNIIYNYINLLRML